MNLTRKTVLVIEDDPDLRHIFRDSLKFSGFNVYEADDGPAALRVIEDSRPDLVVLDLGLPTLDGHSVRQEIAAHAQTRDIPVVIVTGSDVDSALFEGDCVLRKPITPEALIAAVRSCFASVFGRELGIARDRN